MRYKPRGCAALAAAAGALALPAGVHAAPTVLDPTPDVRTAATGFVTPIRIAFIGPNDLFVLEKNTGSVQRVIDGALHSTVLDLAVNFASERCLLGVALHPSFPLDPGVYLSWTESSTGMDSGVLSETPLLGNRSTGSSGMGSR